MKLLRLIFVFAIGLAFMACSNVEMIPENEDATPSEYIVSMKLTGEIDVSQEPLSKSTQTNDIYGINVYYDEEKDGVLNDVYGYGLFDNLEDMKIPLLSGYKYKFDCSLVKNGKNTLFSGAAFGATYTGYAYPFQTGTITSTRLENKFILGSNSFAGLVSGSAHLKGSTPSSSNASKYAPGIERYYGETTDYTPTANGEVSIALKKTIFGAKFVIEGIISGTGTLTASCGDLWSKTTTANDIGTESIYSYPDISDCWKNESTLPMTASLSFTGSGGGSLATTQSVTFKRNTFTVVTFQIPSGTFSITEEPLDEDSYIDLDINSDGVIDTPVIPTEN
jgi:hypothetical protein